MKKFRITATKEQLEEMGIKAPLTNTIAEIEFDWKDGWYDMTCYPNELSSITYAIKVEFLEEVES